MKLSKKQQVVMIAIVVSACCIFLVWKIYFFGVSRNPLIDQPGAKIHSGVYRDQHGNAY